MKEANVQEPRDQSQWRTDYQDFMSLEELQAIVGENTKYYEPVFAVGGEKWNWAAFFLMPYWLLYRKMYLPAVGAVVLLTVVGLASPLGQTVSSGMWLPVAILCGWLGNRLYYRHARRLVARVRSMEPNPDSRIEKISKRGGTSVLWPTLFLLVNIASVLGNPSLLDPRGTAARWERFIADGETAYQAGRYTEAEKHWMSALKEAEEFGEQDPRLATSLNNLGLLYHAQGKYAQAEPLHHRALATYRKALGLEHPYVATSLDNLAGLYRAQGRYTEAAPRYQRSLAIREKALGPDHPDVAQSLNNLAWLYHDQGKYAQAEPLYQRSLAIWEKALGPEHPEVATGLENYAVLLRKMDRNDQADKLEARAQAIREKHAQENTKD
jgi:tetratricopeptide (TPR) repeat protein